MAKAPAPPPPFEGDTAVEEQVNGAPPVPPAQPAQQEPVKEGPAKEEVGLPTQYSPEQIEGAKQRLSEMKPTDLIALENVLDAYSEQFEPAFPEARAIVFTELVGTTGAKIHITARDVSLPKALDNLVGGIVYGRDRYGLQAQTYGHNVPEGAPAASPGAPKKPVTPTAPNATSPTYTNEGNQAGEGGTDVLNKIVVLSEKVEFHVGKFKWPFTDHRLKTKDGAQIIADLFDQDLGWTPAHFAGAAEYTPAQFGELFVDWEKPDKYYNVIRIHG